jgi:N-acetylglutamate synthase-like GNAT family acetyltransferase
MSEKMPTDLDIQAIPEFSLPPSWKVQIGALLQACFSGYPSDRIYLKQLPAFRLLAFLEKKIVGHLAVEHRVINNDGNLYTIFGLTDVCVDVSLQRHHIATRLLEAITTLGKESAIDFLVLTAGLPSFYQKHGFQVVDNPCQWVLINQHYTYGVAARKAVDALMIKPLGDKAWSPGILDFLGHVF